MRTVRVRPVVSVFVHALLFNAVAGIGASAQSDGIADLRKAFQVSAASPTLKSGGICIQPDPAFMGVEYNGPFKKLGAHIAGKPEIRTVEHPPDGSGRVCSLPVKKKFELFVKDTFEPVTFIVAGFNAGISQAANDDPTFEQGAEGFGRRFGAAFADGVSGEFWGTFFYPTLLREDPRYYRLGEGSFGKRLYHSMEHSFVTHRDSGRQSPNFSEWMGTTSTVALGNLYHPGNRRGFQPAARRVAYGVAYDMGFDVLREFWPEIILHLHLPFVKLTAQRTPPAQK